MEDSGRLARAALGDSQRFVQVRDRNARYYGGDQAWYEWEGDRKKTSLARKGACGTVASANITAYLAAHNPKCAGLYPYPDDTKENYILHMKEMYRYVAPRHIGGWPLGIWPISMVQKGVEAFARDRGIHLEAVRSPAPFDKRNVIGYIKRGLESDSPVAMLIGANALEGVEISYFNGYSYSQRISMHWVTITEMETEGVCGRARVKVSTWGGWAQIDLDQFLGEPVYGGLLYFLS